MPRPRKDLPLPRADAAAFPARVEELGALLRDGYRTALVEVDAHEEGTQATARLLQVNASVASRIRKASESDEPSRVLFHLPGPEPQREFVEGLARQGCPDSILGELLEGIETLEELVSREFGDLKTFHTALAGLVPGALQEFLGRERQAVGRALTETDGIELETLAFTTIYVPGGEGTVRTVRLSSFLGLTCWRTGASFTRTMAPQAPGSEGRGLMSLDRVPFDVGGLEALRVDDLCARPTGHLELTRFGPVHRYELEATGLGPDDSVDLRLGEADEHPVALRCPSLDWSLGISLAPTRPVQRFFLEIACPRDFLEGASPEHFSYSTLMNGPAEFAGQAGRLTDLRSSAEAVERLELGDAAVCAPGLPRHDEFLRRGLAALDQDPGGYHLFRVFIQHPFPWIQTMLSWVHPDTPRELLMPRKELYL